MKHFAAIFTIIYRFFSNIQYKKYARFFELVLCVIGIFLCVKIYKSWSEVQHFYHGYSLEKLTKDNSSASISFFGTFNSSGTDTIGFQSIVWFETEKSQEYINLERDIRNDSLRKIVQNVYKERMPDALFSHNKGVWKYDIRSFDTDGQPIYIEVKTTNGPLESEFYISDYELAASRYFGDRYRLYRVYNFENEPKIQVVKGCLDSLLPVAKTFSIKLNKK